MTTIITKNSSTASSVPVAGDLTKGELAVNVTDKKLYTKDNGGSVVKLVGSLGNQEASAVAITGGSIDGTPIGGTTASTASFTTVSASGNVTLSGGTANGVAYLNGSKVITSGSALTFDGTNLGIGTSSPSAPLMVLKGAAGADVAYLLNAGGYGLRFQAQTGGSGTNSMLYVASGETLSFGVNNSEQMRLTSTGLGIGTSSPQGKLHVKTGTNQNLIISSQGGNLSFEVANDAYSANTAVRYYASAHTWYAGGNNMFLDSSGNLGLGVTPSAWSIRGLQVASSSIANDSNDTYLTANGYFDGSWKYVNSDFAAQYYQVNGVHAWRTASSGTAGDAITFTQAATLDVNGNFMVGVTSTSFRMNVVAQSGADRDVFAAQIFGASNGLTVKWNHATTTTRVNIANIPTSSTGLASGDLWNDSGTLKIA